MNLQIKNQARVLGFDSLVAALSLPIILASVGAPLTASSGGFWGLVVTAAVGKILVMLALKQGRGLWSFFGWPDFLRLVLSTSLCGVFSLACLKLALPAASNATLWAWAALDSGIMIAALTLGRLVYRIWRRPSGWFAPTRGTIIVGAGEAGHQLARLLQGERDLQVLGFVDDDPKLAGRSLANIPILGPTAELPQVAKAAGAQLCHLAIPSASASLHRTLIQRALAAGLEAKTLPPVPDIVDGKVDLAALRPVAIDDLLGRKPIKLNTAGLQAFLAGKVVLVTGGGGSIGKELCQQILAYQPQQLVVFEQSEYNLFSTLQLLERQFPPTAIAGVIGDVRNRHSVAGALGRYRPQIIFHAAAYKHVPLMEMQPWEAISTNALGTNIVASEAQRHGVEKFILISTDKAVNPTNVMGATKRVAEQICQHYGASSTVGAPLGTPNLTTPHAEPSLATGAVASEKAGAASQSPGTKFIILRFGNVLGSAGSVVPEFLERIRQRQPLQVTHPEITRFFMTIPEAVQLVLEAGSFGSGGEIFVLDMGAPVKIMDLATDLIRLSGLEPHVDITIDICGLRPGEKLYEEVLADAETTIPTANPLVRVARARPPHSALASVMATWTGANPKAAAAGSSASNDQLKAQLQILVPEYHAGPGCLPLPHNLEANRHDGKSHCQGASPS